MKSVQGDSGHAQAKMVADVYSHIIDDDRRMNAQRFEETFYSLRRRGCGERTGEESGGSAGNGSGAFDELLAKPEMAALLKTLAKGL